MSLLFVTHWYIRGYFAKRFARSLKYSFEIYLLLKSYFSYENFKLLESSRNVSETTPELHAVSEGCFTNLLRALQNNLTKIHNARNHIYGENFKLKLCTCTQSMDLGTCTKFQLEILIRGTISAISWRARETLVKQPPVFVSLSAQCGCLMNGGLLKQSMKTDCLWKLSQLNRLIMKWIQINCVTLIYMFTVETKHYGAVNSNMNE